MAKEHVRVAREHVRVAKEHVRVERVAWCSMTAFWLEDREMQVGGLDGGHLRVEHCGLKLKRGVVVRGPATPYSSSSSAAAAPLLSADHPAVLANFNPCPVSPRRSTGRT